MSSKKVKVLFAQVIADFGPAIARVAASFEANPAIREELIQDIGLAIWSSIESFSGSGTLKGFVLRIAHNKSVDHVAKEAFRNKVTHSENDDKNASTEKNDSMATPYNSSPEIATALTQQQAKLFSAIRQLSLPLKEVITLLLEDMSYTEIAVLLDISVSNVGVRVNRAKSLLKETL